MIEEQKMFKRIDETSIVVDGLIWVTSPDKAQKWRNPINQSWLLNIVIDGQSYYPTTKYKGSETPFILVKEQ